ncbi:MAG: Asp-tRNA(Asn)/Glu-tRNA(Gln) amidotransferase subunit GatB [Phycisphaerales bacterium]|nr:Asp-tRNA(Asn)/Glu-tRNA(Gln) amidotransferase subunit GatB [Phycisphaerales bacterium]
MSAVITSTSLIVGLEIHVELATRTRMFSRVASMAAPGAPDPEPNTLIDPVVLGLPGALPVLNRHAIELSIRMGLALGCTIATTTRWDRKGYFYPDLPKGYQISQYDQPLCGEGHFTIPLPDGTTHPIRIIRAHLEEDAGKLLHELPGGIAIDHSIVDLNRAGTPLLEIVTAPDFTSADQVEAFARLLRATARFLGVSEGVMQKGHMRFEPNINCELTLSDGRAVRTPVVEVKNLNSFKAVREAIEYELREQPRRWQQDGLEMGAGMKSTRGWDDQRRATFLQREKEDAHDYRYFPDPDLLPVTIDPARVEDMKAELPELPHTRAARYHRDYGLGPREAEALVEERAVCEYFEACTDAAATTGLPPGEAGKAAANIVLQVGLRLANERGVLVSDLGATPAQVAGIIALRHAGEVGSTAADTLFETLCESEDTAAAAADRLGLRQVRDQGALASWVDAIIADPAHAQAVADVRAGKMAAVGRLIGGVMALSAGQADARAVRELLLAKLNSG